MSIGNYKSKGPRVNLAIKAARIKLIDADGRDLGVMMLQDALKLARDYGLDIMEVAQNTDPPVCKMLDYGKYKYQSSKKEAENKKKQKVVLIKEIKLRPNIGDGDYKIKVNKIKELLEDDCKVKVTMKFRGREIVHQDIGLKIMKNVLNDLDGVGKIEKEMENFGSHILMMIVKV